MRSAACHSRFDRFAIVLPSTGAISVSALSPASRALALTFSLSPPLRSQSMLRLCVRVGVGAVRSLVIGAVVVCESVSALYYRGGQSRRLGVCGAAPSFPLAGVPTAGSDRTSSLPTHASGGGSTPRSSATLAAPLTPLIIFPPSVRGPLPSMRTFGPIVHSSKQPWSVWLMSATSTSTPGTPAASSSKSARVLFAPFFEQ
mmetsp:Transcript_4577/g.8914  ORF Transcript_4577/g.8914 Transcript_4577/m.8914 type:complete len:201 (+) Transcript_4577:55-657(+)